MTDESIIFCTLAALDEDSLFTRSMASMTASQTGSYSSLPATNSGTEAGRQPSVLHHCSKVYSEIQLAELEFVDKYKLICHYIINLSPPRLQPPAAGWAPQ